MNDVVENAAVVKKEYKLASGKILEVGVNFRSLLLMTSYPNGGFEGLQKIMKKENDNMQEKIEACGYMIYCLIRSAGQEVTVEEAQMMIGVEDIGTLFEVFEDYKKAMEQFEKKTKPKKSQK
ncbi:MAG: hypothetical protein IJ629_06040 [Clostridia bacterium]|nr:hypothetical protein [Clostridia bacterium]